MIRPSFTAHLVRTSTRLVATTALALATVALVFAFAASPQASAQAHKSACTTRAKHDGSHTCPVSKNRKGHAKGRSKTGTHRAKHHATDKGTGLTRGVAGGEAASEATCSDGASATANGEGLFTCADGSEPGCEEGFTPVVSSDGSALLCEPEAAAGNEGSGEEEAVEEEG